MSNPRNPRHGSWEETLWVGKGTGPGTQGCEDFSSIFEGPSAGFSLGAGEAATLLCWLPGKTCALG